LYGIKNSEANPDQIPAAIRQDFISRFSDETGRLKLGLAASYQVLAELKDPQGEKFKRCETELINVMGSRNSALLNHGWSPVRSETFEALLAITLNFLDLREEELPAFPLLPQNL
jgi:hypothetical protein